jgi:hypothetical protein
MRVPAGISAFAFPENVDMANMRQMALLPVIEIVILISP